MSETKPAATAAKPADTAAAKPAKRKKNSEIVKIKNTRKSPLCTSKGTIEPGKTGTCTVAEARQYRKYIELV